MDIQDLQARWQEYDRKLDAGLRLNARVVRDLGINQVSSALRRLSRSITVELLINLGGLLWLGSYAADRIDEPRHAGPAAVLGLFALLLTISCAVQLARLARIDYSAQVLGIQKQLEALRIHRLNETKWVLLLAPLLWTPLLIVGLDGLFGLDAYALFGYGWLGANLLFGVVAIPLLRWLARVYAGRAAGTPLMQRLLRDIAGHNLSAARDALTQLAEFEKEPEPA